MITLSANFQNACAKQTNQSIFKLDLETSYIQAKATHNEDWKDSGLGTIPGNLADISSYPGSVVCKRYGYENVMTGSEDGTQSATRKKSPMILIKVEKSVILKRIVTESISPKIHRWAIAELNTDDFINGEDKFQFSGETIVYMQTYSYMSGSFEWIDYDSYIPISTGYTETTQNCKITLHPNKVYAIFPMVLRHRHTNDNGSTATWDPMEGETATYKCYRQTDLVFNSIINGLAAADMNIQITNAQHSKSAYNMDATEYFFNFDLDRYDGRFPVKEIHFEPYVNSILVTRMFYVLNQYGEQITATTGQFRAGEKTPINTSITYDVHIYDYPFAISSLALSGGTATVTTIYEHGYSTSDIIYIYQSGVIKDSYEITVTGTKTFTFTATGSGTTYGGMCYKYLSELTNLADGDAINFAGKANCRFILYLYTTKWYETPIVDSVECYFPTSKSFVRSDDMFGTALPLLQSIPSYEAHLDPIGSKCSISEPQFKLLLDRSPDKGLSEIEKLIHGAYLTGNEAVVTLGFKGMDSSDFCAVTTGIIKDYEYDENFLTFNCSDVLRITKDPFGFDSGSGIENVLYAYTHPVDIILDMLYRIGVPHRLINVASVTTVKGKLVGWHFFRYFEEKETDLKSLIDEITELLSVFLIPQEDGIIYLKYPFDDISVFTFDSNNSYPIGKARINLDSRINECQIRKGFWNEYNCTESDDINWTTVISYDSQRETGRNTIKVYDNKWLPLSVVVSGISQEQAIGEMKTNLFGYGATFIIKSFMIGAITCLCILLYVYFGTDLLVKKVILNSEELNKVADEKVKIKMDSLRTLPLDSLIKWTMSNQR